MRVNFAASRGLCNKKTLSFRAKRGILVLASATTTAAPSEHPDPSLSLEMTELQLVTLNPRQHTAQKHLEAGLHALSSLHHFLVRERLIENPGRHIGDA